jgi:hypothetical protein
MRYNVFLCPELRVKIVNIEAESQEEAIEKAEELFADDMAADVQDVLQRRFPYHGDGLELPNHLAHVELSEDCFNALVDEVGNEDSYSKSKWYTCESKMEWSPRFEQPKGNKVRRVFIANRVDYEDSTDQIIGVWEDEDELVKAVGELNEWATDVWQDGQWVMAKDDGGPTEVAYITCAVIQ